MENLLRVRREGAVGSVCTNCVLRYQEFNRLHTAVEGMAVKMREIYQKDKAWSKGRGLL